MVRPRPYSAAGRVEGGEAEARQELVEGGRSAKVVEGAHGGDVERRKNSDLYKIFMLNMAWLPRKVFQK